MRSSRRNHRLLGLLLVILTALAGSASALAQVAPASRFTATPLSPSSQYSATFAKDMRSRDSGVPSRTGLKPD